MFISQEWSTHFTYNNRNNRLACQSVVDGGPRQSEAMGSTSSSNSKQKLLFLPLFPKTLETTGKMRRRTVGAREGADPEWCTREITAAPGIWIRPAQDQTCQHSSMRMEVHQPLSLAEEQRLLGEGESIFCQVIVPVGQHAHEDTCSTNWLSGLSFLKEHECERGDGFGGS